MIEKSNNGKVKILEYPDMNSKYWTKIQNWDEYYIHPDGFIKSIKISTNARTRTRNTTEKILSMFLVQGYLSANLVTIEGDKEIRKSARLHRLVAETFIPKIEGKFHVNHKNGIKHDASFENLEWCTPSENEIHSHKVLGKVTNGISKRLIKVDQLTIIRERYANGENQNKIALDYNVSPSTISNIIREKTYTKHLNRDYITNE